MLNQEQGLRGVLSVSNDILYSMAQLDRSAFEWDSGEEPGTQTTIDDVTDILKLLRKQPIAKVIDQLAAGLSTFDWRSSDAPNLSDAQKLKRRAFRGSGGYVALRQQVLAHLAKQPGKVGQAALVLIQAKER